MDYLLVLQSGAFALLSVCFLVHYFKNRETVDFLKDLLDSQIDRNRDSNTTLDFLDRELTDKRLYTLRDEARRLRYRGSNLK